MRKRSSEVGQAGLIVMLVMVVLLTLGVSVASRSTSDLSQSNQEAETSRVFDVAEIGIETALNSNFAGTYNSGGEYNVGNIYGSYSISEEDGLEVVLEESQVVAANTEGYSGVVNIEWSKKDCADDAASIIVSIFDSTNNTARRVAFEGCDHSDGFEASDPATSPYRFLGQINVSLTEDLVRIRPVYNESWVRVTSPGPNPLPTQYYRIFSSANNDNSGETRAISVARTIPTAPAIFDYVLFSGGSITK